MRHGDKPALGVSRTAEWFERAVALRAGHVKDYVFQSMPTEDGYHRRGFQLLCRFLGEGVADLPAFLNAMRNALDCRDFYLTIEGLDNRADVDDQRARLEPSLNLLRMLV
jgi:sugar phosphate isomerase/epimerase